MNDMEETRGGGEEVERIRVVVIHEGKKKRGLGETRELEWEGKEEWCRMDIGVNGRNEEEDPAL